MLPLFNPVSQDEATTLLANLTSGTLSIAEAADRHGTTMEELAAWLSTGPAADHLASLESAGAKVTRAAATLQLPKVAAILGLLLSIADLEHQKLLFDPRDLRGAAFRQRAAEISRRCCTLLARLSKHAPGAARAREPASSPSLREGAGGRVDSRPESPSTPSNRAHHDFNSPSLREGDGGRAQSLPTTHAFTNLPTASITLPADSAPIELAAPAHSSDEACAASSSSPTSAIPHPTSPIALPAEPSADEATRALQRLETFIASIWPPEPPTPTTSNYLTRAAAELTCAQSPTRAPDDPSAPPPSLDPSPETSTTAPTPANSIAAALDSAHLAAPTNGHTRSNGHHKKNGHHKTNGKHKLNGHTNGHHKSNGHARKPPRRSRDAPQT